jgi:hypothetical protein
VIDVGGVSGRTIILPKPSKGLSFFSGAKPRKESEDGGRLLA